MKTLFWKNLLHRKQIFEEKKTVHKSMFLGTNWKILTKKNSFCAPHLSKLGKTDAKDFSHLSPPKSPPFLMYSNLSSPKGSPLFSKKKDADWP